MYTMDDLNNHFKLPMHYNKGKTELKQHIINDLELVKTIDSSSNSIYSYLFNNDNPLSNKIVDQAAKYYTTDVDFLRDNQQLLKTYSKLNKKYTDTKYESILNIWNEIKGDTGFKDRYYYVGWNMFEFLNKSESFLQLMSFYNMVSPLVSLCIPIIILIIPFLVIRVKGLTLTIDEYVDILKVVMANNAVGKLFTHFNKVSTNEKAYLLVSAFFYVFSIYQNILICIRFNSNMRKIHDYFKNIGLYLEHTIDSMNNYLKCAEQLTSQKEFCNEMKHNMAILSQFKQKISNISEYKITSYKKFTEIGHILKYFYEFYEDQTYHGAFMYSFGFNGYIDCLEGLQNNINERKVNLAEFTEQNKKNIIKKNYYACLKDEAHVKNTVKLHKSIIVTGPNASGKTTILKSALINIIFSQQFGCGFYQSATLKPYKHIHCYLNIPDTSGRDSLFQAEARRCKDILDIVQENKDESHFCIFDELYSGTNPEEAVISATAFMEYLIQKPNVSCMLTTHFIKVCKKLKRNSNILNYHMVTDKCKNNLTYKYELKKGISTVKGGISILYNMNYPKDILDSANKEDICDVEEIR